jgi:hypothetical protein
MYKTMGVYVFSVSPIPVANLLTEDNNDAIKPPIISYMWALCAIVAETIKELFYK